MLRRRVHINILIPLVCGLQFLLFFLELSPAYNCDTCYIHVNYMLIVKSNARNCVSAS